MPRLILWKDEQMDKLREDMDRLYHRVYGEFGIPLLSTALRGIPLVDLSDIEDVLIVRAKIVDIDPNDLDISVTHDTLRISTKTKKDRVEDWHELRVQGWMGRGCNTEICRGSMGGERGW